MRAIYGLGCCWTILELLSHSKNQQQRARLGTFATDSSGQLDVLWHDGHTLGVDGAQVGVLEETNQVGLRCLLKRAHGLGLEPQVSLEILRDFSDETLEWELSDQELSRLLEPSNLSESDGARSVPMRLLDSTLWDEETNGQNTRNRLYQLKV